MQNLLIACTYFLNHINVAGWTFLVTIAWKLSWKTSKFFENISGARLTLDKLATNHLPHLQESLDTLAEKVPHLQETLGDLRSDVQDMGEEVKETRNVMLQFLLSAVKKD